MSERWRILVVDDNEQVRESIRLLFDGEAVSADGGTCVVDQEASFTDALERVERTQYDLVILDIRDDAIAQHVDADDLHGDEATEADVGVELAAQLRKRRFVPIIFWTAVPQYAGPANEPFVTVLSKSVNPDELVLAAKRVFDSGLPSVHRALIEHVEAVTRDFMADFVETNWADMGTAERKGDMAHVLSRRLGRSLADGGDVLAASLSNEPAIDLTSDGRVHPMRLYVVPPVGDLRTGELVLGPRLLSGGHAAGDASGGSSEETSADQSGMGVSQNAEKACWYVVLTPSCDLVASHPKAEFVVVAECCPLQQSDEYKALAAAREAHDGDEPYEPSGKIQKDLLGLFRNGRHGRPKDRDYFLPAAWSVPALIVDFQRVAHLPHADLQFYERRAQLDGPYAEALINQATRYLGRVGTPDLDTDHVLAALE